MYILLASPFFSQHWDAGHFWARALSRLGHRLTLWDYRADAEPPAGSWEVGLVLKGDAETPAKLRPACVKLVCYWPDRWGRALEAEASLEKYDAVYTPVRPTPAGARWLPGAWDETVHTPGPGPEHVSADSIFVGTATDRKAEFVDVIMPTRLFGNGWLNYARALVQPVYLREYASFLNQSRVAINIHRDDEVGLNRRFFEMVACTFTITDLVPGVEEILGPELTEKVAFSTPAEGAKLLALYLAHPEEATELWRAERTAIAGHSYRHLAVQLLEGR